MTTADKMMMKKRYPNRDTPVMSPNKGYRFIVVKLSDHEDPNKVFTKAHSCYLGYTARFQVGVCIDYQTREKAQRAADSCNAILTDGDFAVREVDETP
jgi:hypothetical protein